MPGNFMHPNCLILPVSEPYRADQPFFLRMSAVLATVIVVAFLQWAARGYVDPRTAPVWLHIHGLAMVGWLGLLVLQNYLALTGNLHLHRTLGWASLGLLLAIGVLGLLTGLWAVQMHRVPPFWSNSDMLALALVQVTFFEALVIAALVFRRRTEWHRRFMLGAAIILMKAALDRLLPLPIMGLGGPIAEGALQLVAVAVLARHDWVRHRRVHPATIWVGCFVILTHWAMNLIAGFTPFASLADRIAS